MSDQTTDHGTGKWVADSAWTGSSLETGLVIEVEEGVITGLSSQPDPEAVRLPGIVVPGMVNAHSHAFHRLLRGKTHRQRGDFWLWREHMYQAASTLTPESYERVALAVFVEMALAGFTSVGEFHYLHHQAGGVPYQDPNEMGHAVIRAARRAGIRICLLDTGYFTAGFGAGELHPVQTRFADRSPAAWLDRAEALITEYQDSDHVVVGLAPHSVRAVPEEGLAEVARGRRPGTPVHVHVSEQQAENAECLEATGLTPAGLLARNGLVDSDTTLIHATHVNQDDIETIGTAKATVCYCATTERDLADGIGPAADLADAGARLSVGSDSHAVIDPFEEMRGVEMHARLVTGRRGVFSPQTLLEAATTSGSRSLGFPFADIAVGSPADFIVIDPDSPRLAGIDTETALDTIVFSATSADVSGVFVSGMRIVEDGRHRLWDDAREALIP
ncbi:MAG TPA: formimidoylglutamate deiminase [Acidimicrobiia bacterium]|nr:formimidoylglutamate deiminase [Acidimicrobiia bacterium]